MKSYNRWIEKIVDDPDCLSMCLTFEAWKHQQKEIDRLKKDNEKLEECYDRKNRLYDLLVKEYIAQKKSIRDLRDLVSLSRNSSVISNEEWKQIKETILLASGKWSIELEGQA